MFFRKNYRGIFPTILAVMTLSATSFGALAEERIQQKKIAERYKANTVLGEDQARVVYYRLADGIHAKGAANIYLDQEIVTALQPGGHAEFCVKPGLHTLGAYLNDAYLYQGKSTDLYRATLKGGSTYFLKVREDGITHPYSVSREAAEFELKDSRSQVHLLNRASQVEACRHYDFLVPSGVEQRQYVLQADQAFSGRSINRAGRAEVAKILLDLQKNNAQIVRISVEGHTDPLDSESNNQLLGQVWADAVRQALIDQGAPQSLLKASSLGNRQPLKNSCYGSRDEQRACYAPNRRVTVNVEMRPDR
jgi:OOP family OmpA-OmpF porin